MLVGSMANAIRALEAGVPQDEVVVEETADDAEGPRLLQHRCRDGCTDMR